MDRRKDKSVETGSGFVALKEVLKKKEENFTRVEENRESTERKTVAVLEENCENDEVDVGLDISTSVVGLSCVSTKQNKVYFLDHIKLDGYQNEYEKTIAAKSFLEKTIPKNFQIRNIFVEESAKMFTMGASSAGTLFKLSRFNALVSFIAKDLFQQANLKDINVRSARSKLGVKIDPSDKTKTVKEKVRSAFLLLYPQYNSLIKTHMAKAGKHKGQQVPDKTSEDELDSLIIVLGGRLIV